MAPSRLEPSWLLVTACTPPFGMLPTDNLYGPWPNSGEMGAGGPSINTVRSNLVYILPQPLFTKRFTMPSRDFSDDFHVFRAECEPGQRSWHVDANRCLTQTECSAAGYPFPAPFNRRFFLILNVSIPGAKETLQDSPGEFPNTMTIDYRRVYSLMHLHRKAILGIRIRTTCGR